MKQIAIILALAAAPLTLQAAPFQKGDAKAGQALHKEKCVGCHIGQFGGDGSRIYTRADRKVKSAEQLAQRIAGCNNNLGLNLFPEDEQHLGAFLNGSYYKFK